MLIEINNGTVFFGALDVFENISFIVNENEKVALVGRNGSGKTTLLRVLSGHQELEKGQVFKSNGTTVTYLKQNALIDSKKSVKEEMYDTFSELIAKEKRLEELSHEISLSHDEKKLNEYGRLSEEFKMEGGYTYESEIMTILHGFGFEDEDLERNVSSFSGGEKTKLAFAKLLLSKPDLLLLDEPTNHLDLKTIEWLENYLSKYKKAMVIVSHDRVFLDKVCNVTYELEYGNLKRYGGNYTYFTEQKKNDLLKQEAAYKRQQKDIKRLEELIEKFRYKKNKAAFAQSKIKYLERMERIEDPRKADTKTFNARFVCDKRGGKNVLSLQDYEVGYNNKPLIKLNLEIQRGDRICIMGDNGTGKSTLLKSIIDEIPAISGYKMLGHQIEIGYFDQNMAQFTSGNTVLEEVWNEHPEMDMY
ncbi:MAG: ABC-F family ATP-binding cassette domain-containing protein, partial [Solobacterium sp.]|nr:ABC-F family ATP-binding cassette domain-containing protein [Solobacterium sp.]